jgi:hypothetical protein
MIQDLNKAFENSISLHFAMTKHFRHGEQAGQPSHDKA